jgi:hypothetical protein
MAKPPFDPQQLPIDAIAGEPAVALERLAPAWLRQPLCRAADWMAEGASA